MRLPASLAMALGLHALALLALPALWQIGGALADRIAGRQAPPPEAHGEVIPIKLPTANKFELVTELGSIAKSTSGQKADTLPSAQAARVSAMSLSQSLADAAREAQAAYERLHPQPEKLRFVAELRLADRPSPTVASEPKKPATAVAASRPTEPATPTAAPPATQKPVEDAERKAEEAQRREQARQDARQAQEARDMLAQAQRIAAEQARRDRDREQAEERARSQRALQQAIDQAARQPLTRTPDTRPAPRATQRGEDPHPKIFNPAEPYRGTLPDVIAEAPPLPDQASAPMTAGGPVLGAGAAPERGPGEAVANRAAFFQRLTNHLFQINQVMLAEAIRASPRMTVEVHFMIDRNGRVIEAAVSRSTGDSWLDEKAVAVIQRASPMPRLSSDMPQQKLELSFPVQIYR